MVAHQAIGIAGPVKLLGDRCEYSQKGGAILIIIVNQFTPITPRSKMIDRIREF
jgi:hypothetical protein